MSMGEDGVRRRCEEVDGVHECGYATDKRTDTTSRRLSDEPIDWAGTGTTTNAYIYDVINTLQQIHP